MAEIQHKLYWINVIKIQKYAGYAKSALKAMDSVHKLHIFIGYESDHDDDGRYVGLVGFLLNLIKTQKNGQNSAPIKLDYCYLYTEICGI